MSAFITVAAILLILVLGSLLWPLWRKSPVVEGDDAGQALAILREQRAELDAELAAGRISSTEHTEGVEALARRLVEEETAQEHLRSHAPRHLLAGAIGGCALVLCAGLYVVLGNPAALDPAKRQPAAAITSTQIAAMVEKLAAKVAEHPEDAEARLMLSRSYMVLGRYQDAAASYAKLAAMLPENADVLASWGDAVANAEGGHMTADALALVERALKIDPDNVKALALAGTAAFEKADYTKAIALWERMAGHVDPQSETGQSARAMISEARRLSGATTSVLTASGLVSLAPALKDKITPQDTVFVFARPAAGGPPLAAMRFTAADLPAQFDFTKAPLMAQTPPDAKSKILVVARISKSGSVAAQTGDLEGSSEEIPLDAKSIKITISRIVGSKK
jgi:cytochrome c-type biogenesis protein CcmH